MDDLGDERDAAALEDDGDESSEIERSLCRRSGVSLCVDCCEVDRRDEGLGLGVEVDLSGFGRRGRDIIGLAFDVDRAADMAGSSRMEGARWRGGVIGRWMDKSDTSFDVVDGCDRVASAFACFALETASAKGAGVGEAWGCVLTPGTISDASSLEYTEEVLLLARDPRSIDRL